MCKMTHSCSFLPVAMVENLASKHKLTLSLNCNASLGYHIQAILPRSLNTENFNLPSEFIEVNIYFQLFLLHSSFER